MEEGEIRGGVVWPDGGGRRLRWRWAVGSGAGWAIGENDGGRWVTSRGRRREWTQVAAARRVPRN